jgi:hypothetical protein
MSRFIIGSRAALIAALLKQVAERGGAAAGAAAAALAEEARALAEELFLDALFIVAQFPGGQIPEADKCSYALDVRRCAGLCRATWAEEAFWSGLVRVRTGPLRRKRTRLMYAAMRGDTARVAWLLARGAPREAKDIGGQTALHWASLRGRTDAVRALLAAGANVDAADNRGATPLWTAADCWINVAAGAGHNDVVGALLAAGANPDGASAVGTRAMRPLHAAIRYGRLAAVTLLLDAGADVNALYDSYTTPLAHATTPEMRALLVARGGV